MSFQIGAGSNETMTLSIDGSSRRELGLSGISLQNVTVAAESAELICSAIDQVSRNRAGLGGAQNRLEHTQNNLANETENLTAAESRIRDADMAQEMMTYLTDNILRQSAQAILAQANQQMQGILQIIQ